MRLKGKTALIAGASRNIGRTIALTFAREGANVIPVARKMNDELKQVARECEAFGVQALPVAADVGDHEQVNSAARFALERFGNGWSASPRCARTSRSGRSAMTSGTRCSR